MTTPSRRNGSSQDDGRLSLRTILIFALPALPIAMMHIPVGAVIPGFYAKHTTVTLSAIGGIFLLSRIFDAVIDPGIGYLSDRTRSHFGKRKPWIAAGTVIAAVSIYLLFTPAPSAGPLYLLTASMALYLGWTVLEIPYRAWSAELTHSYTERSRISVQIAVMGALGTILFMGVSLLPVFKDREIGPDTMRVMALVVVVLLPVLTFLALARIPEGKHVAPARSSALDVFRSVGQNKPLQIFAVAYIFGGLANGVFNAVLFIYVDSYLAIGDRFTTIYVFNAMANLVALPAWNYAIARLGQHRSLALSWFCVSALQLVMLAVAPGPAAFLPMVVFGVIYGVGEAATKAVPYALLGDIVDYEILRSGVNRSGSYFAFLTLVAKLNFAIGGGVALLLLGLVGYQVGHANDLMEKSGFLAIFIGLPALLFLLAGLVLWRFPLDERRQDIIRRRIEQRAARNARNVLAQA
ncbi:MAG: MFS transporter [Rhizomicrobium sp.]